MLTPPSSVHPKSNALLRVSPGAEPRLRTESSNLLSVLDQLHPHALSDSRVRLLGLDTDLLKDDALGVGGTTERRRLVGGTKETLLVVEIGPAALTAGVLKLARGIETSRLSCALL